ncbi:MAG: YaaA family protein [Flavobacteriales bacterium]|nr:YaaA family protein [Flavobacteriales bacterium]
MKIVLSPTKTMMNSQFKIEDSPSSIPFFQKEAINIHQLLKGFSKQKIKALMKLSENLNTQTIHDIQLWDSDKSYKTPAVFAYQGTSFKYLEPQKWKLSDAEYAQNHLLILSGLYGILRPFDWINKYRLEMGLKFEIESSKSLIQFWKDKMTNYFNSFEDNSIINLASKEYSNVMINKSINSTIVDCTFYEKSNNSLKVVGSYSKAARGCMANFIVKNKLESIEELKEFNELGYNFSYNESSNKKFVFVR